MAISKAVSARRRKDLLDPTTVPNNAAALTHCAAIELIATVTTAGPSGTGPPYLASPAKAAAGLEASALCAQTVCGEKRGAPY